MYTSVLLLTSNIQDKFEVCRLCNKKQKHRPHGVSTTGKEDGVQKWGQPATAMKPTRGIRFGPEVG